MHKHMHTLYIRYIHLYNISFLLLPFQYEPFPCSFFNSYSQHNLSGIQSHANIPNYFSVPVYRH
ncbi:hypothetical protein O3M35_010345 [Rhynocoris fuscipes]|uniref:Uncharacterized protein n=1 Tax=Rhynocoris fuscipes TaxID=488301 RepID=A0AAW1D1Q7_9HEMI